eukprot:1037434-Rhodomonas_salina.1
MVWGRGGDGCGEEGECGEHWVYERDDPGRSCGAGVVHGARTDGKDGMRGNGVGDRNFGKVPDGIRREGHAAGVNDGGGARWEHDKRAFGGRRGAERDKKGEQ